MSDSTPSKTDTSYPSRGSVAHVDPLDAVLFDEGLELRNQSASLPDDDCVGGADGLFYYGARNEGGPTPCRLWALDATRGETVWTYDVDDQSLRTSPAIADGTDYDSASSMGVCPAGGCG